LAVYVYSYRPKEKEILDDSTCPCKYLEATSARDVETILLPVYKTMLDNKLKAIFALNQLGPDQRASYGNNVTLTPTPWECSMDDKTFQACQAKPQRATLSPKYTGRYPYLVVKTDAGVIADHNAIYNERFMDFTMAFTFEHITAEPRPWSPAAAQP
jgi:hypothetical protein